jgi:hypothetical protein
VHDLSCETCLTRYSLRGILREPATMTMLAVGSTLAAGGVARPARSPVGAPRDGPATCRRRALSRAPT